MKSGSADLSASNLTLRKVAVDFQRASAHGRYLRFGVREHTMVAIFNGIAAYAAALMGPFASTILNFITYALATFGPLPTRLMSGLERMDLRISQ